MNIGETSATLPVIDALAGSAGAAPVGGAAGFADRLAEAMGPQTGAGAAQGGATATVTATATATALPVAVALPLAIPVSIADVLGVKPVKAGGVLDAVTGLVPDSVLAAGLPDVDGGGVVAEPAIGAFGPCGPAANDGVATDAVGLAGKLAGATAGMADEGAAAVPEPDADAEGEVAAVTDTVFTDTVLTDFGATVAPVPVGVAVAASAAALPAGAVGFDAPEGELPVAKTQQQAARAMLRAGAFAVSVTLEAAFALPPVQLAGGATPPVSGAASGHAEGKAPKGAASDGAATDGEAIVAGGGKAAKPKAAQFVLAPEPVAARTDAQVAAVMPAGPEPVVVKDVVADPAGPAVQQAPQPLPQAAERLAAQPLRTDLAGWEQVLGERIAAELSDDGQEIELSLAPEKLGPLRIKLEMVDGLAQVKIITATPEAARVFTEAQHRLTEGLARAGIELGSQSAQSGQQGRQAEDRTAPRNRITEFLTHSRRIEAGDAPALRRAAAGLVNLMA